jgi:hypothetical protein
MSIKPTEIIRRVWQGEDGVYLEVCDWPDGPEFVCLRTNGEKNEEWFGRIEISMSPDYAAELGRALLACAKEKGAT